MESDGERLDEVFESPPDETQDWYFDLPQGAWERQEAKNRNLRQTLLNKQSGQEAQQKPESDAKPAEKKRRWFGGSKDEEVPEKPRFSRLSDESREDRLARLEALKDEQPADTDEWTTEPDADEANRPLLRRTRSDEEKRAFDDAPPAGEPISRWDAMFGSGIQEGSIVDGMRQWATTNADGAEGDGGTVADAGEAKSSEWDEMSRNADESSMLEVLRRRRAAMSGDDDEDGRDDSAPLDEDAAEAEWEPIAPSAIDDAPLAAAPLQPAVGDSETEDSPGQAEPAAEWEPGSDSEVTAETWAPDEEDTIEPVMAAEVDASLEEQEPVSAIEETDDNPAATVEVSEAEAEDDDRRFEAIASNLVAWPETAEPEETAGAIEDTGIADHFEQAMSATAEFDDDSVSPVEAEEKKPGLLKRLFGRGSSEADLPDEDSYVEAGGDWEPVEPTPLRPTSSAVDWAPEETPVEPARAEVVDSVDADSPFRVMDESGWMPVTGGDERKELDTSWMAPAGSTARDAEAWSTPKASDEPEAEVYDEEDPWAPFELADVENAQEVPGSAALAEEIAWEPAAFEAPVADEAAATTVGDEGMAARQREDDGGSFVEGEPLDDDDIEADEEDWAWSPAEDSVPDELPNLATGLPEEAISEFAPGGEDLEEPAAAFVVAEAEPGPEALVAPLASPDGIAEEHDDQPDTETDRESDAVIASADSGDADDDESPETPGQDLRWDPTGDEVGDPAPQEPAQSAFSWAATESVDADESPDTADWSDWSDETAFARAFESPAAEGLETGVVSSEASTTDGGDASEESWDFAAALQAGFEEEGQPGGIDEPTVSEAANQAEQDIRADIEALDASDVVAAMQAERVEEQDANAEDDAEEFDFGAALRAAEETVAERELSIADESAEAAGTKPDDEARDAWAPAIDRDEADIVPAVANADPGEAAKEHSDPEPEDWSPAEQPLELEPEEPAAAWAWDFSPREEEPAPADESPVSATREEDAYSLLDDDPSETEDEVPGQTAATAKSETDEDADAWSPAFDRDEVDAVPAVARAEPGEAAKEHSDPEPEEWSPTEQPLEMEPEEPAAAWAWDFSPSEEEPAAAEESTAAATREEDPYSLLDDDQAEMEDEVPGQTAAAAKSETDEDADAWAAIAAASGYNAEEEFEPPTFGKISRSPREMDERGSWLADHFPEQPPAPDPVEEAFAEHDDEDMERDLVLRAFEAHAATDVDEEEPLEPGAFQELFGEEAQGIVDDIIEPREVPSFAKMRLAPQRTSAPGSAPFSDDDDWAEGEEDEDMAAAYAGDFEAAPFLAGSLRTADPLDARKTRTWVRELVETGLLALLVFLSVRASFQNFKVDGSSMSPTLADGQFLIVNKLVYSEVDVDKLSKYVPFVSAGDDPTRHVFHGPERGDIIVLRDPSTPTQDLIKRVMGLPGEKIEVYNGAVYINDQRLEEPYLKEAWGRNGQGNYPAVIVPEGTYFVMGDNRDNSKDSRSSQIGFIAEDLIIGRAELSYLPLDAFGLIGNGGATLSEQDGRPRLTSQLKPESATALASP